MTLRTEVFFQKIKSGVNQGLIKGWKGFIWLLKILIPISFATALLVHFGVIYKLDFILTPVMAWLSLPASAALVLIIGLFTGIYGTVAALSVMHFSIEQMTLIAIFTLISHNIIQESIVQGSSGMNAFFAAFYRITVAFLVTFICTKFMGVTLHTGESGGLGHLVREAPPFMSMLKSWGWGTLRLAVQIFCIIMPLMVVMELAKLFHLIDLITKIASPGLSVMGLSRSTGMLWLTASIFGLAYGAAVMVEETKTNDYKKQDLTKLHLSIGINHSMIEDPALFLPLGLPVFWLWVPRLVAAVLVTWVYSVCLSARRVHAERAVHKKLCDH